MARDQVIDILRGFAIVCMFLSNLAGEVLNHPHPFLVRVLGSSAAPIFILLSGYMLGLNIQQKKHSKAYFVIRGIFLYFLGALIDIVSWKVIPFFWFDVLYLLGVSTIIVGIIGNISFFYAIFWGIIFIIIAPILQNIFGYNQPEYFEWESFSELISYFLSLKVFTFLNQWFISGWFPIFPWLGVFLLGVSLSRKRKLNQSFYNEKLLIIFGFLFFTGIFFWNFEPKLEHRGGYSEFFYPPTLSYFLVFLSLSYSIYILIEKLQNKVFILATLGEYSLFLYLAHLGIITLIKAYLPSKMDKVNFISFLFLYLIGVFGLILLGFGMKKFKPYTQKIPFPINMIFH